MKQMKARGGIIVTLEDCTVSISLLKTAGNELIVATPDPDSYKAISEDLIFISLEGNFDYQSKQSTRK